MFARLKIRTLPPSNLCVNLRLHAYTWTILARVDMGHCSLRLRSGHDSRGLLSVSPLPFIILQYGGHALHSRFFCHASFRLCLARAKI